MLLFALGCAPPTDDSGDVAPWVPVLGETTQVAPGPGIPAEVVEQDAHNNLDVIRFDGRAWLALRLAPSHFASAEAVLYVLSSDDEETWRFEARFARDTDLREPRFLELDGRLYLYFAVLGADVADFEPQGMMVTERGADGAWSDPEWFHEPGFIPWRTRTLGGTPYLLTYDGGENIYDPGGEPLRVHWLTTADGRTWEPVIPDQPVVETGGGSETDIAFAPDGALVAVTRNEAGDETGWGSKICRAEPASLGDWRCVGDPRKYDSPLVFTHEGTIWLVGRRNVTEDGNYDLFRRDLSAEEQTWLYEVTYWQEPKRCALWRVDPDTLAVQWEADLPSRGDTCFAGILPIDDHSFAIYNYSSPLDGPDVPWVEGQQGPTNVYRTTLTFVR